MKIGAKTEASSASMLTYVRTVSLLIIKLVVTTTLYSELGLEPIIPNRDDKSSLTADSRGQEFNLRKDKIRLFITT